MEESIATLIASAVSAVQGISGIFQNNTANKLEEQYPRPKAQTADSIKKLVSYAYGNTMNTDIPGGDIIRNQIAGSTSAAMKAAGEMGSGSEAFGLLSKLVQGEQNAYSKIAQMVMDQNQGAKQNYMSVLAGPAYQEERRVDYWNNEMPYLQAAETAKNLRQAGSMNMMSGFKDLAGTITASLGPDMSTSLGGDGTSSGSTLTAEQLQEIINKILQ